MSSRYAARPSFNDSSTSSWWRRCCALRRWSLVVYLALVGRKVLTSGRFPPPGARVLVDTHILAGAAAARRGKSMLLAAALIPLLGLPGLLYVHIVFTDILAALPAPRLSVPSHVPQLDLD